MNQSQSTRTSLLPIIVGLNALVVAALAANAILPSAPRLANAQLNLGASATATPTTQPLTARDAFAFTSQSLDHVI